MWHELVNYVHDIFFMQIVFNKVYITEECTDYSELIMSNSALISLNIKTSYGKGCSNNLSSKQGNMYCNYDRWFTSFFFFLYSLCCGWWLWSRDAQLPLCCVLWWMCLRSTLQHTWHIPDRHITKWNEMAGRCDCLHKPLLYHIQWSLSNAHSTQLRVTAHVIIVPADILASSGVTLSAGTHCDYHPVSFANMLWVIDVFSW